MSSEYSLKVSDKPRDAAGNERWMGLVSWGLALLALLLGIYARWPELPQPFLWLDEVWRAYCTSSTHGMISFLHYMKTNTMVLLFSEWILGKTSLLLFGHSPFAFRIWPFLFGIGSIVGAFALIRRLGYPMLAPLAALTIAVSWGFVYHSREYKPYAMDLALTLWTAWAMLNASNNRRIWLFLLLLSVMAFSTIIFIFVYPALMVCYILLNKPQRLDSLMPFAIPPVIFLLVYFLFLRPQNPGGTTEFWAANYITSRAQVASLIDRYPYYMSVWSFTGWKIVTILFLVVLPLTAIIRKDPVAIIFLLPFFLQIIAATIKLYPFLDRPSYYLYGLINCGAVYAIGSSIALLTKNRPRYARLSGIVLCTVIFAAEIFSGTLEASIKRGMAWPVDQGKLSLETLAGQFGPHDKLCINGCAYYMFMFYGPDVFPTDSALRKITPKSGVGIVLDTDDEVLRHYITSECENTHIGDVIWFFSSWQPNAYKTYREVLEPFGDIDVVIGEEHQSLIKLRLQKPFTAK